MPRMDIAGRGLTENLESLIAHTASGNNGGSSGWGAVSTIRAQLNVTAVSGSAPTLDVIFEDTLDGVNWNTVGTLTQKNTTGREVINITAPFADTVRVSWVISGTTPSFTFSVDVYSE